MALDHPVFGDLPDSWSVVAIGDIATKVGSGATPRGGKQAYVDEGVALIRSQNVLDLEFTSDGLARITDEAADKLRGVEVREDDVLINITGASIARCTTAPPAVLPARVNQHVAIIRLDSRGNQRFLKYVLNHPRMKAYIVSHNAGASREAITKAHIDSFVVPLPPLREQRAIAEVLGALDERIAWCRDIERRLNDVLTVMASFVGEVKPMAEVAALSRSTVAASEIEKGAWHHYSLPSFDDQRVASLEDGATIKSAKYRVPAGSVLISKLNPHTPRVWVPDDSHLDRSVCSTEFLPFVPRARVSRALLYGALRAESVTDQMGELVTGSTSSHQRVRPADVERIRVPNLRMAPPELVRTAESLLQRGLQASNERGRLMEARDDLLPRLVSGHLRVADVDAVLAEGA